jgi:hypothetical protein
LRYLVATGEIFFHLHDQDVRSGIAASVIDSRAEDRVFRIEPDANMPGGLLQLKMVIAVHQDLYLLFV